MPNGGSDCCGTCWFNRKNRGKAGYHHVHDPGPDYCEIRDVKITEPMYTYCANHPYHHPEREELPVGPVLIGVEREIWKLSPDTEAIRNNLLVLLNLIQDEPKEEHSPPHFQDAIIVWQLGEFREERAVPSLRRILAFESESSRAETWDPQTQSPRSLIRAARAALTKISGDHGDGS